MDADGVVMASGGVEITSVSDWPCCGATACWSAGYSRRSSC